MSTERTMAALFHPARIRILQVLSGVQEMTAQDLAAALPNIPHATLYRHLAELTRAELVRVVREQPVRNLAERVYALVPGAAHLRPADMAQMDSDSAQRLFALFAGVLLGNFEDYLQTPGRADFAHDRVSFGFELVALDDAELDMLRTQITDLLLPFQQRAPSAARPRLLAWAALPFVAHQPARLKGSFAQTQPISNLSHDPEQASQ